MPEILGVMRKGLQVSSWAVRHEKEYVPEARTGQQELLITKVRGQNCAFAWAFRYFNRAGRPPSEWESACESVAGGEPHNHAQH